jgi:formiminotetrahydrofolate cyclodeaminase
MNLVGLTLDQFVRLLASDKPAPGGGSVAALTAALSAALCAMVARLTVGKEKYRDGWEAMERVRDAADELAREFMNLVEQDTEAYNEVLAAVKLPKETEVQRSVRQQAIEKATQHAAAVPLATLEHLSRAPDLVRKALEHGNPNCLTDAGVAVQLLRAAAAGAAYNVRINLSGIKNGEFVEATSARMAEFRAQVESAASELERIVDQRLNS